MPGRQYRFKVEHSSGAVEYNDWFNTSEEAMTALQSCQRLRDARYFIQDQNVWAGGHAGDPEFQERDGCPKQLAPPWKTSEESTQKLGDACDYFSQNASREYPLIGQESIRLARNRCLINVVQVILTSLVQQGK